MYKILTGLSLFFVFGSSAQSVDSSSWHLSGQLPDKSVKALLVCDRYCKNVLTFYNGSTEDTLDLTDNRSTLPVFGDSCGLRSVQLDGIGREEIIISWNYLWSKKAIDEESLSYTIEIVWNLDTKQKMFYITPSYYRFSKTAMLAIDTSGTILSTSFEYDTCQYHCQTQYLTNMIIVAKVMQTGDCPDDGLYKRREGTYCFKDGRLLFFKD